MVSNSHCGQPEKEHLIDILTVIFTVALLYLLVISIKFFYIPLPLNVEELSKTIAKPVLDIATPEPVEFMQYVLGVLCSPIFILLSYLVSSFLVNKNLHSINDHTYKIILFVEIDILVWLIYKSFQASNFLHISGFLGNESIVVLYPWEYTTLIFPVSIILWVYLSSFKIVDNLIWLFCAYLIVVILCFNIFNLETHLPSVHHFNVVFYSISQILQGKTLLVDLTSQYGLYGSFLEPIFRLLGLSVLNFSVVMALLVSLSFVLILLFLNRIIHNKIVVLLGFASVSFYNYLSFKIGNNDPYFQYHAIRFIFPCLVLYLSIVYYCNQKNKFLYGLIHVISAISILWNFETGIVVFVSWLAYLAYLEFLHEITIHSLVNSLFKTLYGCSVLLITMSLYVFYTFIRSGCIPDMGKMVFYQSLFSQLGFMTLPMPPPPIGGVSLSLFIC